MPDKTKINTNQIKNIIKQLNKEEKLVNKRIRRIKRIKGLKD